MEEMSQFLALRDAMFEQFSEEIVREIAEREVFSVDVVPDMQDNESVIEMIAEMVHFVVTALSGISEAKAGSVLVSAGIPEEEIDHLLS